MTAQEPRDVLAAGVRRLVEEGGRLLADLAARQAAPDDRAAPDVTAASDGTPASDGTAGADGPFAGSRHAGPGCAACPVCQGLALVRDLRPEAVQRVATAAVDLAAAVGELLAPAARRPDVVPQQDAREHGGREQDGTYRPRAPRVPVQHIDITD